MDDRYHRRSDRRGPWRGPRGWNTAGGPPPWWPENETWPPRRAPWQRRRGFGCLFGLVFILVLWSLVTLVGSALAALGLATRPGAGFGLLEIVILVAVGVFVLTAIQRMGSQLWRTGRTLDALADAAQRVARGDYSARVQADEQSPRPVAQLVQAFDTMAERLDTDERQRRSLLADVSHELRTPLAVVQGNVEAILDGVHPADEEHLGAILDETRVLSRLVEDLRTLALAEAGTLPLHREPTDLGVLIGDVAASFEAQASAAGVTLETAADDELPILEVDPVRIREVLSNLVGNALRYTDAGQSVTIRAARERNEAILTVVDTGRGIDPEVLPHVFERFAKSSESRGSGLGLAIARNLVVAHGGTIDVSSGAAGTTFTIRLPIDAEQR